MNIFSVQEQRWIRRFLVAGCTIGAFGVGIAATSPIDTSWIGSGKTLSSSSLQANLQGLQNQVITLESGLETLDTQHSSGATGIPPEFLVFATASNPSQSSLTSHPSGASVFTASSPGLYRVTLSSRGTPNNRFTALNAQWVIAGSATRLDSMGMCRVGAPGDPANEDLAGTCMTVFRATAGQTISLLPQYYVTWVSTGVISFYFNALIERIGG